MKMSSNVSAGLILADLKEKVSLEISKAEALVLESKPEENQRTSSTIEDGSSQVLNTGHANYIDQQSQQDEVDTSTGETLALADHNVQPQYATFAKDFATQKTLVGKRMENLTVPTTLQILNQKQCWH